MKKERGLKALLAILCFSFALIITGCGTAGDDPKNDSKTYTISVATGITNGNVVPDVTRAAAGVSITMTITPNSGYRLKAGTLIVTQMGGSQTVTVANNAFIMPAYNVIVNAAFEAIPAESYLIITALGITNGSVVSNVTSAEAGNTITLKITPNDGYRLKSGSLHVTQTGGSQTVAVTDNKFTMPAYDVTVSAVFEAITYNVTIAGGITGGTVTVNHLTAVIGTTIELTITPNAGFIFKAGTLSVTQTGSAQTVIVNNNAFIMPASDVTVTAQFEKLPDNSISVIFEGLYEEDIDLSQSMDVINLNSNQRIEITVNGDYETYIWYLNNNQRDVYGNKFSVSGWSVNGIGLHTITVIVITRDGTPYSKNVTFRVAM